MLRRFMAWWNEPVADTNMVRLLGYLSETEGGEAFARPAWLYPASTWWEAAHALGYIENGSMKPFIPREGSYFLADRLTEKGRQKLLSRYVRRKA